MKQLQTLILIFTLLLGSCTNNPKGTLPMIDINGKSIPQLNFKNIKDTLNLTLSQILNTVTFVRLETNEDNKLAGGKWSIGEKYLIGFCYDLGIFQFTKEGIFIRKLANIGNGPQEVNSPVWTISKDERQIIIYDFSKPKSFLCFDLNSGLLLKTIPIALEGQLKNIYWRNDSILICAPLIGTGNPAGDINIFWQTLAGKLIRTIPATKVIGSFDIGDDLLYPTGDSYHFRPVNGDTLYQIIDFKMQPYFIFDPQNNLISPESDLGRTSFQVFTETSDFMIVGTFTVTEQVAAGPNAYRSKGKTTNYYIDKSKNKAYKITSFYNDYVGEKQGPALIRDQTSESKYIVFEAITLLKMINTIKQDPNIKIINRDQFITLGLDLKEDDNPVFLIGKLANPTKTYTRTPAPARN